MESVLAPIAPTMASSVRDLVQASQLDGRPETVLDRVRCGGAAVAAAAVIAGPETVNHLVAKLVGNAQTPHPLLLEHPDLPRGGAPLAEHRRQLQLVQREVRERGQLSLMGIQYLQEAVSREFGTRPSPKTGEPETAGMRDDELVAAVEATGLAVRHVRLGSENGALPRAVAQFQPGEMAAIMVVAAPRGLSSEHTPHIVLAGRDTRGGVFVFDSLRTPTISREPARVATYLAQPGARIMGDLVFRRPIKSA